MDTGADEQGAAAAAAAAAAGLDGSHPPAEVVVYGTDWCGDTKRTRTVLSALGVAYRYVNVDDDPEAERRIAGWNSGRAELPTLDYGGLVSVNPSPDMLKKQLVALGLVPPDS